MSNDVADRNPSRIAGWAIVAGGWLILVLAIVLLMVRKDGSAAYGVIAALGAVCVAVGSFLVAGNRSYWMFLVGGAAGFLSFIGFGLIAPPGLEQAAHGQQITCQVLKVEVERTERTTTDTDGTRHTEVVTNYWHSMKCPMGTFTVSSGVPNPVGAQLTMVHVPGKQPEFGADGTRAGLGVGSVGALAALALTIFAWVRSRLSTARAETAQYVPPMRPWGQPEGPPGQPQEPPPGRSAAPYEQW